MNILDENLMDSQTQILRGWHIKVQRIGDEVGFLGDLGFYERFLCHPNYCIVCLSVGQQEVASFIRRFLRHQAFDNNKKRIGKVFRISHVGIRIWQLHAEKEEKIGWNF